MIDDVRARLVGQWTFSKFNAGYVGDGYIHDGNTQDGQKTATYRPDLPRAGEYEVRVSYTAGTNRATNVPVEIRHAEGETTVRINEQKTPPIDQRWLSVGRFKFENGTAGAVVISNLDTDGHVIVDAVQFLRVGDEKTPTTAGKAKPAGSSTAKNAADARALVAAQERVTLLETQIEELKRRGPAPPPLVLAVTDEAETGDYFVCIRGNPRQFGAKTPRGFLQVAGPGSLPKISSGESGRLELARWLASRDNPLTARVMVNRVWHYLLGAGLVRTPDNFGHTGERPTHPELLDHLAVGFMEDGWSVKRLVRSIVLSRTYGMNSAVGWVEERDPPDRHGEPAIGGSRSSTHPTVGAADPDNRLLARANRRRLDAEAIRDAMLAFSGQLDLTAAGDTIRPGTASEIGYEFADVRRSVYVPVFRNRLCDILEVFDFPDPNAVSGSRVTSTLPTQALFLMNSPFVRQQAQQAAARLLADEHLDDAGRIELAFRRALGRPPQQRERELALAAPSVGRCQPKSGSLDELLPVADVVRGLSLPRLTL